MGATTIVPDSAGWTACQIKLGKEGVKWFLQKQSAWEFLWDDFCDLLTPWDYFEHKFCANMMYSRRTYVWCLYAFGIYEIAWTETLHNDYRTYILASIAGAAIIEQIVEISFVEMARYHYTMDIVVSLVVTFLFYTNGPMTIVASKWNRMMTDEKYVEEEATYVLVRLDDLKPQGDVILPPCCVPFCCLQGREHLYGTDQMVHIIKASAKTYNEEDLNQIRNHQPPLTMSFEEATVCMKAPKQETLKETLLDKSVSSI